MWIIADDVLCWFAMCLGQLSVDVNAYNQSQVDLLAFSTNHRPSSAGWWRG